MSILAPGTFLASGSSGNTFLSLVCACGPAVTCLHVFNRTYAVLPSERELQELDLLDVKWTALVWNDHLVSPDFEPIGWRNSFLGELDMWRIPRFGRLEVSLQMGWIVEYDDLLSKMPEVTECSPREAMRLDPDMICSGAFFIDRSCDLLVKHAYADISQADAYWRDQKVKE